MAKKKGFLITVAIEVILIALVAFIFFKDESIQLIALKNTVRNAIFKTATADVLSTSETASAPQYGIASGGGLIFMNQAYLDKYFKRLKDLGVTWVRFDVDWHIIQSGGPNFYDWSGTDRVVNTAKKYKIKILGTLAYSPIWAEKNGCDNGFSCPPQNPSDFGRFARKAALRYNSSIRYWEIWNEENNDMFWSNNIDARDYIAILKEAYIQIKDVNTKTNVILGGLAITGESKTSPLQYIKDIYSNNGGKYFDAVAVHPYTYPLAPDSTSQWNWWKQLDQIHVYMASKGQGNKKIWITEFGSPTNGPGIGKGQNLTGFRYQYDFMSLYNQSEIVRKAIIKYKEKSYYFGPFFYYSLIDRGTNRSSTENFYGLLYNDWTPKKAYYMFKNRIK